MARKIASTRFRISATDLAGAIHRMKLEIPQAPLFAALPVGVDAVSDAWLTGKKLKPELLATVQALTAPAKVIHLVRQTRAATAPLESRVFSRTGGAPYVMAAPRTADEWDIAIFGSEADLNAMLEGLCALKTGDADTGGEPVILSAPMLGVLAAVADNARAARAAALASFAPAPEPALVQPQSAAQLASLLADALKTGNSDWTTVLLDRIAGPTLFPAMDKAHVTAVLSDFGRAGLLEEDGRLTPEGVSAAVILDQVQATTTLTTFSRTKTGAAMRMTSFLPAGALTLMLSWTPEDGGDQVVLTPLGRSGSAAALAQALGG